MPLTVGDSSTFYIKPSNAIASNYIKSLNAFINFEKSQNNSEKMKNSISKVFFNSIANGETETLTYFVL
jgi:hypothetical protein